MSSEPSASGGIELEHRHLRGAIEYAVAMAEELTKRKRADVVPRDLRPQFGKARIPTGALGRLRRAIEADDDFRSAIAAGALPELVDPIGRLWLQRPTGWEADVSALLGESAARDEEADLQVALRRADKRRFAAEQAAARALVDADDLRLTIGSLEREIDTLRADIVKADEAVDELRTELVDVRIEARHARDRERAALARLEAELAVRDHEPAPAETTPVPEAEHVPPSVDLEELADLAQAARDLAERTEALLAPASPPAGAAPRRERRRPLRLPGGIIASSRAAAEHLLRSDAAVLVDGYNVSKLGWANRSLADQRDTLLDALENVARRFGTDITVVFDGAAVIGAHTTRRRLLRVTYSPEGVIADDVIRDEVRRLPASRPVVVVTDDAEIVADVRGLGANVVPSNALLAAI